MRERTVIVELAQLEAAHLTDLIEQFAELIVDSGAEDAPSDPALARLAPDAYRDDPLASQEFRDLTQADLLSRRADDASTVLATLRLDGRRLAPTTVGPAAAQEAMTVRLDSAQSAAWLRTLAAVRLVLANRLGVTDEDDHDADDPRFGVYDWLGFRLEGLLHALDSA